jgi:hypothetical protein
MNACIRRLNERMDDVSRPLAAGAWLNKPERHATNYSGSHSDAKMPRDSNERIV